MKKLLFVNPGPFASLTDTLYYCKLLKNKYAITYIGFNENQPIKEYEGINTIHLNGSGNSFLKKLSFIVNVSKLIKKENFDFILVNYFVGCSIFNIFNLRNLVIDVRTSTISKNKIKKIIFNFLLSFEVRFFKKSTAISKGLVNYLHLPKKTFIIPLGAPSQIVPDKEYSDLCILYVGTFHQRNIEKTVYGFAEFIKNHNFQKIANYSIIGRGSDTDIKKIKKAILNLNMSSFIQFHGEIRYPELLNFFRNHNVGISYIPLEKQFDNQPPTKTFEYLLSGMIVLATKTQENKNVITSKNGIIIGDSIQEISNGLEYLYANRLIFNSKDIQKESQKYSWEYIVDNHLIPYIESFK